METLGASNGMEHIFLKREHVGRVAVVFFRFSLPGPSDLPGPVLPALEQLPAAGTKGLDAAFPLFLYRV